jgi:hypothetical protein
LTRRRWTRTFGRGRTASRRVPLIGKIVVLIQPDALGEGVKMHVRHEAVDGLRDSRELQIGGCGEGESVERLLSRVPDEVRAVLQMTEDRGA